jgi:hypothetical protein
MSSRETLIFCRVPSCPDEPISEYPGNHGQQRADAAIKGMMGKRLTYGTTQRTLEA